MKRLFSLLIALCLLVSVAGATGGDPNIEGGGGGIGEGGVVGDSAWNPGDDGVRVSVMQDTTALCTFDVSNVERTRTQRAFRKKHKLEYKNNGAELAYRTDAYTNLTPHPSRPLPSIISSSGGSNIGAIRSYFTDEVVVRDIADKAGMTYEALTSGDYKLLLEPMAYFKYNGVQYAMSATEAALFDVKVSGDLRYQMGRMTHQNLPFAMFLERVDLTILPWTGATTGRQSNIDILNQLGVGIVSFTPEVVLPDPPGDYIYRTNTDVITSVQVPNLTTEFRYGVEIPKALTPSNPGTATFKINGTTYNVRMIAQARGWQNVWVRWHTPSTPGDIDITVIPPGARSSRDYIHITASVVELEEKTPPDPGYDGPGQGPGITHTEYRPNFRPVRTPNWGSNTHTTWSQWVATWVVIPLVGGYWEWNLATYDAYLDVDFKLQPDGRVPTAERQNGKYIIKSGYGLDAVCKVQAYGRNGVSTSDVTIAQNVLAVFPEFDYTTYDRLLTPGTDYYHSAFPQVTWGFRRNPYSYYSEPTHFTPLWYPDTDYTVAVAVFDAWTPGGMLYTTLEDTVKIRGTMYDDWYIRVT